MGSEEAAGTSDDPRLGLLLGERYRVTALRGSGAMGVVYEGEQVGLGRRVAIKCLHRHLATSPEFLSRFMSEARLASRLNHPNIVRVYDFGTEQASDGPLAYLVMEFCSGSVLGDLVAQGARFPLVRVASIMGQVLSALAEAHDHGIVHRDVKPENVILEPGPRGSELAKLIDFGIAEVKVDGNRVKGSVAGTPAYLSPEVIRGEPVDHQADLYAAGSMLFELITGRVLFDADTVAGILDQQLHAARPDPRVVAPDRAIPDELAAVCLRAVALDRSARFEDADALADAVAAALAAPPSRPPRASMAMSTAPASPGAVSVSVSVEPPAPPSERRAPPSAPPSERLPRPPLQSGPQMRSISPVGRYSLRPNDDRPSGEHANPGEPSFWVLQELESEATLAMTRRRWKVAIEKLRHGIDAATALARDGQPELGAAALTAFGRRMGEALRRDGRHEEALGVLRNVLGHAPEGNLTRALLLEELGLNAALAGRTGDALGAWLDAAEIARACGNTAVEERLERRIAGNGQR
jgi:serine/threonine protein kinase